jgi:hypothetical protein
MRMVSSTFAVNPFSCGRVKFSVCVCRGEKVAYSLCCVSAVKIIGVEKKDLVVYLPPGNRDPVVRVDEVRKHQY